MIWGWSLVAKQFPIDNQTIILFSQQQRIAKLYFGAALMANDNMDIFFVNTQQFIFVGNPSLANDSFMCLLDDISNFVGNIGCPYNID